MRRRFSYVKKRLLVFVKVREDARSWMGWRCEDQCGQGAGPVWRGLVLHPDGRNRPPPLHPRPGGGERHQEGLWRYTHTHSQLLRILDTTVAYLTLVTFGRAAQASKYSILVRKNNGCSPSHWSVGSGSIARKALQALEKLKLVEKDSNGGRRLTSQVRKESRVFALKMMHRYLYMMCTYFRSPDSWWERLNYLKPVPSEEFMEIIFPG